MSLPGLLIEYLVTGSLAIPWLIRLVPLSVTELPGAAFPVLGAWLYFTGMVIDVVAFFVLRPIKWRIRKRVATRLGVAHESNAGAAATRLVRLMQQSKVVSDEANARSSRDRIARGAVINAMVTAFAYAGAVRGLMIGVSVAALAMWVFFESSSHTFELNAERELGISGGAGGRT